MTRFLRLGLALGLASFMAGLVSLAPASPAVSSCAAAGPNHAAVVIQHGDGSVLKRCVDFDGATITGEATLNQTGIAWSGQVFGGFGNAVCAVDSEPARYSSCPGQDYYWAVFVSRGGGAWQLSALGISSLTLADGDAEGFRYEPAAGAVLAPATPASVCAAATPAPTPAATRAATPTHGAGTTAGATAGATTGAAAGATAGATAGAADSGSGSPIAAADSGSVEINGATSGATSAETTPDPAARTAATPASDSGHGPDPGLVLTAIAAGGLGGLLIIRVLTARRRTR